VDVRSFHTVLKSLEWIIAQKSTQPPTVIWPFIIVPVMVWFNSSTETAIFKMLLTLLYVNAGDLAALVSQG
jgi:hypothetical protein